MIAYLLTRYSSTSSSLLIFTALLRMLKLVGEFDCPAKQSPVKISVAQDEESRLSVIVEQGKRRSE
jgi:hypothetical protein